MHRYLVDPEFTTQTGLRCDAETEAYDVIVSDLTNKLKCILDPALNILVQKGEVRQRQAHIFILDVDSNFKLTLERHLHTM